MGSRILSPFSVYFLADVLMVILMLIMLFEFNLCSAEGVSERFKRPIIEFKISYDVSAKNVGLPQGTVGGRCQDDGKLTLDRMILY